jgi:hypothetical protein
MKTFVLFLIIIFLPTKILAAELSLGIAAGAHDVGFEISDNDYDATDYDFLFNLGFRASKPIGSFDLGILLEYGFGNRSSDVGPANTVISGRTTSSNNYHQYAAAVSLGYIFSKEFRLDFNIHPLLVQRITFAEDKNGNIHDKGDENKYTSIGLGLNWTGGSVLYGIIFRMMQPTQMQIQGETIDSFSSPDISQVEFRLGFLI